MLAYIDSEFHEDRDTPPVLISFACVGADGREFYWADHDVVSYDALRGTWAQANVIPNLAILDHVPTWGGEAELRAGLEALFADQPDDSVETAGWYSSYDFYLLCRAFGGLLHLPRPFARWHRDLATCAPRRRSKHEVANACEHNALADARWVRDLHDHWTWEE